MTKKPKKVWCEHIEWYPSLEEYFMLDGYCNEEQEDGVTDGWKYCPICGKKRP